MKSFRQAVEHFERRQTLDLDADAPARAVMKASRTLPQFLPQAEQFVQRHCDAPSAEVRKELVAGVVEFILDGLHVNNKLKQKTAAGSASYRR